MNKIATVRNILVIANQMATCTLFMIKNVGTARESSSLSRKYFIDKISWSLASVKCAIISNNDQIMHDELNEKDNFIKLFDEIFDHDIFHTTDSFLLSEGSKKCEKNSEIYFKIELLISHVKSFENIALESDKKQIICISDKIQKLATEITFSCISNYEKSNLENALNQLEICLNNSLLRLVLELGYDINKGLSECIKNSEKFDLFLNRLLYLASFALWLSKDDLKVSTTISSCLASIESSDLISILKSISPENNNDFKILLEYLEEVINLMLSCIHKILDTKAICSILIDIISSVIDSNQIENEFKKESFEKLLKCTKIIFIHAMINSKELKLLNEPTKFYYDDLKLIFYECEAILKLVKDDIQFKKRVIKRFNIFRNTIEKFMNSIQISEEHVEFFSNDGLLSEHECLLKNNRASNIRKSFKIKYHHKSFDRNTFSTLINLEITEILNQITDNTAVLNF